MENLLLAALRKVTSESLRDKFKKDKFIIQEVKDMHPPHFVDAWVSDAYWESSNETLTDDELDYLNENYPDEIHMWANDNYY